MKSRYKPHGWRGESYRHYLAAKGITSKVRKKDKNQSYKKNNKYNSVKVLGEDNPLLTEKGRQKATPIYGGKEYIYGIKTHMNKMFNDNDTEEIEIGDEEFKKLAKAQSILEEKNSLSSGGVRKHKLLVGKEIAKEDKEYPELQSEELRKDVYLGKVI